MKVFSGFGLLQQLALNLRVTVTRIAEIAHERRGITPDTARHAPVRL